MAAETDDVFIIINKIHQQCQFAKPVPALGERNP